MNSSNAGSQSTVCSYKMQRDIPCGRPIYQANLCICHSHDPDKDLEKFLQEVERQKKVAPGHYHDFSGFVFPAEGAKNISHPYTSPVSFKQACFLGPIDFSNANFQAEANFDGARFEFKALFHKVHFRYITSFDNVEFRGSAVFTECNFAVGARFTRTEFNGIAEFFLASFGGMCIFRNATFHDDAHFSRARFASDSAFGGCIFKKDAIFASTIFEGILGFEDVIVGGDLTFGIDESDIPTMALPTTFQKYWRFNYLKVQGDVVVQYAQFKGGFGASNAEVCSEFLAEGIQVGDNSFLSNCHFKGNTTFRGAHFETRFHCLNSIFEMDCDFQECIIRGEFFFLDTVFQQTVNFGLITAEETSYLRFDGEKTPDGLVFRRRCSFLGTTFFRPDRVKFRRIDLSNCIFLEVDLSRVQFVDVKWHLLGKGRKRSCVYDEALLIAQIEDNTIADSLACPEFYPQKAFGLVAQIYRRLQSNYIVNYQYNEAGDFYVGEQEMVRKAKGKLRQYFCVNFLYKLVSNYGESWKLPMSWLLITIFVFAFLVLMGPAGYKWSWGASDLVFFSSDYYDIFWRNISFIAFQRDALEIYNLSPWQQGVAAIQKIFAFVFVTFFVLVLRRRFKRKSF